MAYHIVKLKSNNQKATKTFTPAVITDNEDKPQVNANPFTYTIDTMTDPQLRVLQEIKFLLVVLVILKLICLFKKG